MPKTEYDKKVEVEVAYGIIGRLDDGLETKWIDYAIKQLENLKFVRQNIPF